MAIIIIGFALFGLAILFVVAIMLLRWRDQSRLRDAKSKAEVMLREGQIVNEKRFRAISTLLSKSSKGDSESDVLSRKLQELWGKQGYKINQIRKL